MYDVDITSDIENVIRDVGEMFERQVPFTVAQALNDTAFAVRTRVVGPTYDAAFNTRNTRFPGVLWGVDKVGMRGSDSQLSQFKTGDINRMTAMVRQKLERDYITNHVTGGTKLPRGSSIAVPNGGEALRTKSGRIAKRNRPMVITNKKDHFLAKDKSGRKRFIARRSGTGLEVVFRFTSAATIKPRFRFYEDAFDVVDRVMVPNWTKRMNDVVRRSRFN